MECLWREPTTWLQQVSQSLRSLTLTIVNCRALTHFILEIWNKDGNEFPTNYPHHLVCGLMRYLRHHGRPDVDFFKDPDFSSYKTSLDADMKHLQSLGVGSQRRQAEILTEEEETTLGGRTFGIFFSSGSALHHRFYVQVVLCPFKWPTTPSAQVPALPNSTPCMSLKEESHTLSTLKTLIRWIKGRRQKPKIVKHHANVNNPERCFVHLFKLYIQKCPEVRPHYAFYLQPKQVATDGSWFLIRPFGHNSLGKTVAHCKRSGISGFNTNHSLRATTAT